MVPQWHLSTLKGRLFSRKHSINIFPKLPFLLSKITNFRKTSQSSLKLQMVQPHVLTCFGNSWFSTDPQRFQTCERLYKGFDKVIFCPAETEVVSFFLTMFCLVNLVNTVQKWLVPPPSTDVKYFLHND